jgi:capsular exopolysaccharide synthesis family protein
MPPVEREAYRRLRANVFSLQKDHQLKNLMITSPEDGEGKSTITYNLAVSIAQLGQSVLVIDCDMRRSSQHILFNVLNDVGLTTVLEKKVSLSDAIQETHIRSLEVLTSGPHVDDPTKLLGSAYMADLLLELAPKYDIILLDTPAVLPVVDTAMLAPVVDGVLIVARCGKTDRESILLVQSQIADLRAKPLGWILNDAPIRPSTYHTA